MSSRSEKFDKAIPYILENEGEEFTDHPSDPGGATKWGVTLRELRAIPQYKQWNADTLKTLTREQAEEVFYKFYWKFEDIQNQQVATKMLDIFVNLPPTKAVKIFQSAANMCGASLIVDGLWGQRTIRAVNSCTPETFLDELVILLHSYYSAIVQINPKLAVFLKGWLNRANRLPEA